MLTHDALPPSGVRHGPSAEEIDLATFELKSGRMAPIPQDLFSTASRFNGRTLNPESLLTDDALS